MQNYPSVEWASQRKQYLNKDFTDVRKYLQVSAEVCSEQRKQLMQRLGARRKPGGPREQATDPLQGRKSLLDVYREPFFVLKL